MSDFITIDTGQTATRIIDTYEPYDLVGENDPILKKQTFDVDFNSDINIKEVVGRLTETVKKTKAYGISAPQVGLPYSIIVIGANDEYVPLVNPKIVSSSEDVIHMEEGCLSFPLLVLGINRPSTIVVNFQNVNGESLNLTFNGLSARIVQHEIDHLNGITFDTKAKPLALKMGKTKREKQMKRFARHLVSQRRVEQIKNELQRGK